MTYIRSILRMLKKSHGSKRWCGRDKKHGSLVFARLWMLRATFGHWTLCAINVSRIRKGLEVATLETLAAGGVLTAVEAGLEISDSAAQCGTHRNDLKAAPPLLRCVAATRFLVEMWRLI